jgi:hypothetical protein
MWAKWCGVNRKAEREGKPIKMFQVVLESSSEVVYKSIKAVMASKPVQTQCVQQRTIKPQAGIESKVKGLLQQMVCKLGGAPWGCVDPSLFSSHLSTQFFLVTTLLCRRRHRRHQGP